MKASEVQLGVPHLLRGQPPGQAVRGTLFTPLAQQGKARWTGVERRSPFLHDDELLRIDDASALPFWEEVEASYHLNSLMRPASDADVADVDRWLAAHRAQVAKRHGIVHDVMALPHGQRLQVTWMGNVKPAEVDWLQELIMGEMRSLYAKGRLLTEVTFQFENDLDMRLVYERLAVGED